MMELQTRLLECGTVADDSPREVKPPELAVSGEGVVGNPLPVIRGQGVRQMLDKPPVAARLVVDECGTLGAFVNLVLGDHVPSCIVGVVDHIPNVAEVGDTVASVQDGLIGGRHLAHRQVEVTRDDKLAIGGGAMVATAKLTRR
ncbi:hypothetical protein PVAP13_3NG178992 [Panicum virgatum]|uniref:Uncharacterized protein n=1 Tax=Panicum virgatum TaxID=38727 RepID=A0A8T0U926_PANVG|nr:hypothetical protein PVAP13_3NG178992 [Panicum virgatum]